MTDKQNTIEPSRRDNEFKLAVSALLRAWEEEFFRASLITREEAKNRAAERYCWHIRQPGQAGEMVAAGTTDDDDDNSVPCKSCGGVGWVEPEEGNNADS